MGEGAGVEQCRMLSSLGSIKGEVQLCRPGLISTAELDPFIRDNTDCHFLRPRCRTGFSRLGI